MTPLLSVLANAEAESLGALRQLVRLLPGNGQNRRSVQYTATTDALILSLMTVATWIGGG
jgi:hypothetical protein